MTARHTNLLLLAILLVGLSGVGISLVALETRKPVGPPVMIVRVVRAPPQLQEWPLIPPSHFQSCEMDGYDSCGDGESDDEPAIDPAGYEDPTSI